MSAANVKAARRKIKNDPRYTKQRARAKKVKPGKGKSQ